MPILSAENNFKKGLVAMVARDYREATHLFHLALEIERQRGVSEPDARYLSYYGLNLAKTDRPTPEAIEACEAATSGNTPDPEVYHNLGRVHLLTGNTCGAMRAFVRGLRFDPKHPGLLKKVAQIGRLLKPVSRPRSRAGKLQQWFLSFGKC